MEKYQMVYEPHKPCEFDDFMALCSFLLGARESYSNNV